MAIPSTTKNNIPTLADVSEAIKSGAFSMDDLMSTLADQKQYVRAGGNYRELLNDGVSVVNGQFARCYKLGDKINGDGVVQSKMTRKKKA